MLGNLHNHDGIRAGGIRTGTVEFRSVPRTGKRRRRWRLCGLDVRDTVLIDAGNECRIQSLPDRTCRPGAAEQHVGQSPA